MTRTETAGPRFLDANGCPTEIVVIGGQEVLVHYDDIPESDIALVDGIRCTTALRTVIDIAATLEPGEFEDVVQHCLDRRLFTVEEALERTARADVAGRLGARRLRHRMSR